MSQHGPYTRTTTIEQVIGTHSATGLPEVRQHDVVTDLSARADLPWDELADADRDWWNDVLDAVHAVDVRVATLSPAERVVAEEALTTAGETCDLEDLARSMTIHLSDVGCQWGTCEGIGTEDVPYPDGTILRCCPECAPVAAAEAEHLGREHGAAMKALGGAR